MGGCPVTSLSSKRLLINLPCRLVSRSRRTANPLDGSVQRFHPTCWCGRTKSSNNFRFSIADFGLGKKQVKKKSWMGSLNSRSDNRKSKIQNRKLVGIVALVVALAVCGAVAQAQQPKKIPRIGYLTALNPATESARSEPFRLALRKLGYIEGQNIAIEYRNAEGKLDRYPELAAELVRLKVDIIVTTGGQPDPGGQECDQDDSHRYAGYFGRSCRGRPG